MNTNKNEKIYNAREDKIQMLLNNKKQNDDIKIGGKRNLF